MTIATGDFTSTHGVYTRVGQPVNVFSTGRVHDADRLRQIESMFLGLPKTFVATARSALYCLMCVAPYAPAFYAYPSTTA